MNLPGSFARAACALTPLFGLILSLTASSVPAATYTWDGTGGNNSWSTGANWVGNAAPASSQDTSLVFAGTTNLTPQQNITSDFLLNALTFGPSAGAFVLAGNPLDFRTGSGNFAASLTQNSASAEAVNNNLALTNSLTVGGPGTGTLTLGGAISGPGGLTLQTGGMVVLTGSDSYTGATTVNGGTLAIAGNGLSGTSELDVNSGSTLALGGTAQVQVNGSVNVGTQASASTALTVAGTARLSLNNGDFLVGSATVTQSGGAVAISSDNNTAAVYLGSNAGEHAVYNLSGGTLGTADLILGQMGTGTVTQTGGSVTSTYGVAVNFDGIADVADCVYNLSAGTLTVTDNGSSLDNDGTFNLSGTGAASASLVHVGHGNVGIFNQSGGSLSTNSLVFSGSAGTYNLDGGTLTASVLYTDGGTSTLNLNGGTLKVGAAPDANYIQSLSRVNVRNGGAVIDTNGFSVRIAQPLPHSTIAGDNATDGGLTKLGAGTLTLTAADTYTGSTKVNAGTLAIDNNPGAASPTAGKLTATGGVTVNNGGTLLLSGSAGVTDRLNNAGTLTLNSGGKFATGGLSEGSPAAGSAAGVGALTLAGGSSVDFGGGALGSTLLAASGVIGGSGKISVLDWTGTVRTDSGATGNDRLLFVSDPHFTAAQLAQVNFYNDGGTLLGGGGAAAVAYNGFTELVPVPEPATWAGGVLLLTGAALTLRRRLGHA